MAKVARKRAHISVAVDEPDSGKVMKKAVKKFVPDNWETILDNIRQMRRSRDAPVDSMGAEKCADRGASQQVQKLCLIQDFLC